MLQFKGSVEPFAFTEDSQRLRHVHKGRFGELRSTSSAPLAIFLSSAMCPAAICFPHANGLCEARQTSHVTFTAWNISWS